ncbi:MAG: hypothetical protein AAFR61_32430 [Bacteroidota bacterium]
MKKSTWAGFHIGMLLFATCLFRCQPSSPHPALLGTWKMSAQENLETGVMTAEPVHLARSVLIEFDGKPHKGHVYIQTVVNHIQGRFQISEGQHIHFFDLTGGLQGEPAWSKDLWQNLEGTERFIHKGKELMLVSKSHQVKTIWEKVEK